MMQLRDDTGLNQDSGGNRGDEWPGGTSGGEMETTVLEQQ